jgi:hypothetical protein
MTVFNRSDGAIVRRFGSHGIKDCQLSAPLGLCFMHGDGFVAVADSCNHCVSIFSVDGGFVRRVGVGLLKYPQGVACSAFDEIVVADTDNRRVVVFSEGIEMVMVLGRGDFSGVALHGATIVAQDFYSGKCVVVVD